MHGVHAGGMGVTQRVMRRGEPRRTVGATGDDPRNKQGADLRARLKHVRGRKNQYDHEDPCARRTRCSCHLCCSHGNSRGGGPSVCGGHGLGRVVDSYGTGSVRELHEVPRHDVQAAHGRAEEGRTYRRLVGLYDPAADTW